MATFIYTSETYYPCACSGTAILCMPEGYLVDGSRFLEVTIDTYSVVVGPCSTKRYAYYISYDEDLLVAAHQTLYSTEIQGLICRDCLIEYIEEVVGNAVPVSGEWVPFTFTDPEVDDQATAGTFGAIDCNYKLQDGDLLFSCNFHFTPESTVPHLAFNPITVLPSGDFKERIFGWAVEAPSSSEDAGDQQLACRVLVDKSSTSLQTFVIHRSDDAIDNTLGNNHYEFAGRTEYQISFSGRARLLPVVEPPT